MAGSSGVDWKGHLPFALLGIGTTTKAHGLQSLSMDHYLDFLAYLLFSLMAECINTAFPEDTSSDSLNQRLET